MSFYNPLSWFKLPPKKKIAPDDTPFSPAPKFISHLAKKFPQFKDDVYALSRRAFETIRRADVTAQPMSKVAQRIGSMTPTVVGRGRRAEQLQEIIDQSLGMPDALEWLAWAEIEGWRAIWIQDHPVPSRGFVAPDLRGGGIMRWQAGGLALWDGWTENNVVKVEEIEQFADQSKREALTLDRERIVLFRPGAGLNPDGDLDLAYQMFLLAERAALLDKAMAVYTERHSLPREVLKLLADGIRPDELGGVLQSAADKLAAANAHSVSAITDDRILEYLEPSGTTWQFLVEYRRQLEGRAHKLLTGENLTSDSTGSGPSGSTSNAQLQLDAKSLALARKLAEPLTHDLLPWVERRNDGWLAPLGDNEPIPYLQLRPGVEKVRLTVAEACQLMDRGWKFPTNYLAELAGHERVPGQPDVFESRQAAEEAVPVTEAGNPRRTDRTGETPPKNSPAEDLRNIGDPT